jgi:L-ascorbate metabolism protein UlaG (beta-lactamase superfamily)
MQWISRSGIDVAILPIGDLFTMGPEDSLQAIEWLKPSWVFPSHFNTWPPIAQDASQWARQVRERSTSIPQLLAPGESATWSPQPLDRS